MTRAGGADSVPPASPGLLCLGYGPPKHVYRLH